MKIHKWKNGELNRLLMERFVPTKKLNEDGTQRMLSDAIEAAREDVGDDVGLIVQWLGNQGMNITPEEVAGHLGIEPGMGMEEPGMGMEEPGMGMEMEMAPEEEEMMALQESKKSASFRKKVRKLLEAIDFNKGTIKETKMKKKRKVTVRKRRK